MRRPRSRARALKGSTEVTITPGVTGTLPLNVTGLTPMQQLFDQAVKAGGHSGNQDSGAATDGTVTFMVDVPAGTTLARFDLDSVQSEDGRRRTSTCSSTTSPTRRRERSTRSGSPRRVPPTSASRSSTRSPGTYRVDVDVYAKPADGQFTWDLRYGNVNAERKVALTATPNPLTVTQGTPVEYSLSWSGLKPSTRYLGVVQYGTSAGAHRPDGGLGREVAAGQ